MLLRVVIADPDISFCKEFADKICSIHDDILSVDIAQNVEELLVKSIDFCASVIILNPAMPGVVEKDAVEQLKTKKKVCAFIGLMDNLPEILFPLIFKMKLDDVLLKSSSTEELKECLERAKQSVAVKRENTTIRDHYVMSKEFLLDRALFSFHKSTKIEDVNLRFGTRFMPGYFRVMLIRSDYKNSVAEPFYDDFPIRQKEMLLVRKHLNDYCSEFCVRYCINGLMFLINYPSGSEREIQKQIKEIFEELSEYVKTVDENLEASICVGKAYPHIWQIQESREDAYRADWVRMGKGGGKLIFWEENLLLQEQYEEKIEELSRRAQRACTVLEVDEFDKCVDDLFSLPNSALSHRRIRKWAEWFIQIFFEFNADLLAEIDDETISQSIITDRLAYTKNFGEFRQCFQVYFDRLFYAVANISDRRSIKPIREAMQYVQENYKNQIRVEDVSKKVNMSASYFSTLFKKQTGTNFTTYVTDYRMQKAKIMLKETDMTISEVSDELGFSDQRYFSKTFKKSVGQSPGDYRKAKG